MPTQEDYNEIQSLWSQIQSLQLERQSLQTEQNEIYAEEERTGIRLSGNMPRINHIDREISDLKGRISTLKSR